MSSSKGNKRISVFDRLGPGNDEVRWCFGVYSSDPPHMCSLPPPTDVTVWRSTLAAQWVKRREGGTLTAPLYHPPTAVWKTHPPLGIGRQGISTHMWWCVHDVMLFPPDTGALWQSTPPAWEMARVLRTSEPPSLHPANPLGRELMVL